MAGASNQPPRIPARQSLGAMHAKMPSGTHGYPLSPLPTRRALSPFASLSSQVYFAPYGDYFTPEYSYIWMRDLPLIKAMGANVVRTYGWQPDNDHTAFVEAVAEHGLYLFATFYMGDAAETPVDDDKARAKLSSDLEAQAQALDQAQILNNAMEKKAKQFDR